MLYFGENFTLFTFVNKKSLQLMYLLQTPLEGAQTTLHLATSEEVEGVTGKYFVDCQVCTWFYLWNLQFCFYPMISLYMNNALSQKIL